jgi:hypothetical protein
LPAGMWVIEGTTTTTMMMMMMTMTIDRRKEVV